MTPQRGAKLFLWSLPVLGAAAFAFLIWPTPYRRDNVTLANQRHPVRENRFSGVTEILYADGWKKPVPPETEPQQFPILPPPEKFQFLPAGVLTWDDETFMKKKIDRWLEMQLARKDDKLGEKELSETKEWEDAEKFERSTSRLSGFASLRKNELFVTVRNGRYPETLKELALLVWFKGDSPTAPGTSFFFKSKDGIKAKQEGTVSTFAGVPSRGRPLASVHFLFADFETE